MNINDLVTTAKLMGDLSKSQIPDKATYIVGYAHINTFFDSYFSHLALIDIDLSISFNRKSKLPKALLKGKMKIKEYEDGEIIQKLWVLCSRAVVRREEGRNF